MHHGSRGEAMSHYPTCEVGKSYPEHPVTHCAECGVIDRALRHERNSYSDAISEEVDGRVTISFRGDSPYVLVTREVLVGVVEQINLARAGITQLG